MRIEVVCGLHSHIDEIGTILVGQEALAIEVERCVADLHGEVGVETTAYGGADCRDGLSELGLGQTNAEGLLGSI